MKLHRAVVLLAISTMLNSCNPDMQEQTSPQPSMEDDLADIKKVLDQFGAAYNAGDAAAVASLYTTGAILMPPNQPIVEGNEAMESRWQSAFEKFSIEFGFTRDEIRVAGDWGFARGTYQVSRTPAAGGETVEDNGKYLVVLRRQDDGSWLFSHDIDNSDRPITGP